MNIDLDYRIAIANCFLDMGDSCIRVGDFEQGMAWNHVAARILVGQNRDLSSQRIESNLQLVAKALPKEDSLTNLPWSYCNQKKVWLHVFNNAFSYGGHTAMAIRWINSDSANNIHSVALLADNPSIPEELSRSVRLCGGEIYTYDCQVSVLKRAAWLRKLAYKIASHVVLHVAEDDVIAGMAFGISGGPPVLLVNHAAHVFWVGSSIADLVVNCRGSRLEEVWTQYHRGVQRFSTIPIPLLDLKGQNFQCITDTEKKDQIRDFLGIPSSSVVILTVGAAFKYIPIGDLDFVRVCEQILQEVSDAFVVAIGPEDNSYWRTASERVGSRLRAVGRKSHAEVSLFQDTADIYIEGFPFGSTTALLEAGLRGVPVVLAPAQCPPPYGSDGIALDEVIKRPINIDEYKNTIIRLSKNPLERKHLGNTICEAVKNHHTGSGWRKHLGEAIGKLPKEHVVYPPNASVATPEKIYKYWIRFQDKIGEDSGAILEQSICYALHKGLRPRFTRALLRACKDARKVRFGKSLPWPILFFMCNLLLPLMPLKKAEKVFREITAHCKPEFGAMKRLKLIWPAVFW